MNVYDQLTELTKIPRAWEYWKEYRKKLTDRICAWTDAGTTALIVGAGPCNDLDLGQLTGHFGRLILLDTDEAAMEAAVSRQLKTENAQEKVQICRGDVVGISPETYRAFADLLTERINRGGRTTPAAELSEAAVDFMQEQYGLRKPDNEYFAEKSVDYVICAGVHSQLNAMFPWIWEAFAAALGADDIHPQMCAREFNNFFQPAFDRKLEKTAREGVIYAVERERIGVSGGIEGAWQAVRDIETRRQRQAADVEAETELLWPFDLRQEIIYHMKLYKIRTGERN